MNSSRTFGTMFQSVKNIGFSTLALLAILLTSFRPVFAETNSSSHFLLQYDSSSSHGHAKYRVHADISSVLTEADSEEADDADDEASLNQADIIFSAESSVVAGIPFILEAGSSRLSGPVSVDPKSNVSAIYLKHRQILR